MPSTLQICPSASKSFAAEPYCAATSYNGASLPLFVDYPHLTFWFFFFTVFILSIWLAQALVLLGRGGVSRLPIRETRGFGRARVGGALTAIASMVCGIAVLTHTGPHSQNLGGSVDPASTPLALMSYPRGWDHYVPSDTIAKLGRFSAVSMPRTS